MHSLRLVGVGGVGGHYYYVAMGSPQSVDTSTVFLHLLEVARAEGVGVCEEHFPKCFYSQLSWFQTRVTFFFFFFGTV